MCSGKRGRPRPAMYIFIHLSSLQVQFGYLTFNFRSFQVIIWNDNINIRIMLQVQAARTMLLNIEHEPNFLGRPQLVGFHKHFEHRCPQEEILGRKNLLAPLASSRTGNCGFLCWKSDIFCTTENHNFSTSKKYTPPED